MTTDYSATIKEIVDNSRRIVIKVGTSVSLTDEREVDTHIIDTIHEDVKYLLGQGKEVVLVVSGSKGLQLAREERPANYFDELSREKRVPERGRILAQGMNHLYNTWQDHFKGTHLVPMGLTKRDLGVGSYTREVVSRMTRDIGEILLRHSPDDLGITKRGLMEFMGDRTRISRNKLQEFMASDEARQEMEGQVRVLRQRLYARTLAAIQRNLSGALDLGDRVRNIISHQLQYGNVPFINEDDLLAGSDSFGNNDELAAVVTNLIGADFHFILTDVDGLWNVDPKKAALNPENYGYAQRIGVVEELSKTVRRFPMSDKGRGKVGTGGMIVKLDAIAKLRQETCAVMANGKVPYAIGQLFREYSLEHGSLFLPARYVGSSYSSNTGLTDVVHDLLTNPPGENNFNIEWGRPGCERKLKGSPLYLDLCLRSTSNGDLRSSQYLGKFRVDPDGQVYFCDKDHQETGQVNPNNRLGSLITETLATRSEENSYANLIKIGTIPHVFAQGIYGLETTGQRAYVFRLDDFGKRFTPPPPGKGR